MCNDIRTDTYIHIRVYITFKFKEILYYILYYILLYYIILYIYYRYYRYVFFGFPGAILSILSDSEATHLLFGGQAMVETLPTVIMYCHVDPIDPLLS